MIGAGQQILGTPKDQVNIMGRNVPISSFQTQEQAQDVATQGAARKITAEKQAEEPFDIAAENRKLINLRALKADENAFTTKLEEQN